MEATKKVAGRYVLQEPLGRGGMGAVWRARDEVLKRTIALKEVQIPPALEGSDGDNVNERVLREARAAARLSHPSATTVYDVFEDDGRTFIAMELVDAPTLGQIVAEHGPLEPDEVARIGLALLDALDAAHAVGMVHRDVKPDNVMVTDNGQVKLTDFGIASVKGDPRLTMSGVILGSPSYMAPEQADGKGAGREADLWSLGATLFFAVEGHAPFRKDSPIATLASVVGDPIPESPRAGALTPVIAGLLAKDPAERATSGDVRTLLERVSSGARTSLSTTSVIDRRDTGTAVSTTAAPQTDIAPESLDAGPLVRAERRSRTSWLALGLIALLLIGAVAFALSQNDDEPNQRAGGSAGEEQGEGGDEGTPAEAPAAAEGWTEYQIADTGYQISYPENWEVSESPPQITFDDPESSTSMLVEYTTEPGSDAVAAWEAQAESFAADHPDYSEITIEPTTMEGFDTAANWEFTYSGMHALDIGMAKDDIGFALFFQTLESEWDAEQETLQGFLEGFGPAS
jgi:serine/threonine protein kinase